MQNGRSKFVSVTARCRSHKLTWHWKPCLPNPQMKSLQCEQNVGCLKNRGMNLCSCTFTTLFFLSAPLRARAPKPRRRPPAEVQLAPLSIEKLEVGVTEPLPPVGVVTGMEDPSSPSASLSLSPPSGLSVLGGGRPLLLACWLVLITLVLL